ncbi:MAG: Maf family protein [Candidatus Gracilibacteria bacterium]|jgi:septum formation protein
MKEQIILASLSPRRRELLKLIGVKFRVLKPTFCEFTPADTADPALLVRKNAIGKAKEFADAFPKSTILGVDTIVAIGGRILGKPTSQADAVKMLRLLSGKTHTVYTATCFLRGGHANTFVDTAEVDFLPMTDKEIRAYIKTGEPMDKAGAYAIQGLGSRYIKGIRGDFFTVMGLPVWRVWSRVKLS